MSSHCHPTIKLTVDTLVPICFEWTIHNTYSLTASDFKIILGAAPGKPRMTSIKNV